MVTYNWSTAGHLILKQILAELLDDTVMLLLIFAEEINVYVASIIICEKKNGCLNKVR